MVGRCRLHKGEEELNEAVDVLLLLHMAIAEKIHLKH